MSRVLWLLAAVALLTIGDVRAREQRILQRLVGGHMRNVQQYPEDNDDAGLLTASAGAGRESRQQKPDDDEDKKTLSQQVADGKYGLIQKELFAKPPKRPGIISYENNPEVPKDNSNNYGGLDKNEIWLAENHLLVLKGGTFPDHDTVVNDDGNDWRPIDAYIAPLRQVKIPSHPKVPPPFPVQLEDNGPIQLLGTNSSRTLNGSFGSSIYAVPPPEGFFPGEGPFFPPPYPYPANSTSGNAPFPVPPFPPGEFNPGGGPGPFPFPPPTINGTLPPYFASLPPGAMFLPPPSNQTEFDEDDPSIYYPPPYSFFYPVDNSTDVPPGPLVPGIVLPPPPNFFAPLEKPGRRPIHTTTYAPQTTTEAHRQIYPTTTPIPPTPEQPHLPVEINELRPIKTPVVSIVPSRQKTQYNKTNNVVTIRPSKPYVKFTPVERRPTHRKKPQAVTILKPVLPSTTLTPAAPYENNEVTGRPFAQYGPPSKTKTVVSTTTVPLKAYFSTSNEVESNVVTAPPPRYIARGGISTVPAPNLNPNPKTPTSYYYYEEDDNSNNIITTPKPQAINFQNQNQYYKVPKQYYVPVKQINVDNGGNQQQPQYIIATARPVQYYTTSRPRYQYVQQTTVKPKDTYTAHIARLQQQIQSFYVTPKPVVAFKEVPRQEIQIQPQGQQVQQQIQQQKQLHQVQQQIQQQKQLQVQQQIQQQKQLQVQQQIQQQKQLHQQAQQQIQQPQPIQTQKLQKVPIGNPVYQYSFEAINYQQQHESNYRNPRIKNQEDDKFRPLPRYSVQIQPAIEVTPPPTYHNVPTPSSETPLPSKYYTTARPDYEYEDVVKENRDKPQAIQNTVTVRPATQYKYGVTQNPAYYSSQDDQFDDITKKYFTIFGQKLGHTTPIPPRVQVATSQPRPVQQAVKPSKAISLHGDTLVNYVNPRPTVNPNSEYISIVNPPQQVGYEIQQAKYVQQSQYLQQHPPGRYIQRGPPIQNQQRQPQSNPNVELVRAIPVPATNNAGEGQPGSFISYQLPGDDGAHFYFLTPQLVKRTDQGVTSYFYPKTAQNGARIRRSHMDKDKNER